MKGNKWKQQYKYMKNHVEFLNCFKTCLNISYKIISEETIFCIWCHELKKSQKESTLKSLMFLHVCSLWELLFFPPGTGLENRQTYTVKESLGFKNLGNILEQHFFLSQIHNFLFFLKLSLPYKWEIKQTK